MRAWNYDLVWSAMVFGDEFGRFRTDMGHAAYNAGGGDFHPAGEQLFADPEQVLRFDPEQAFGPRDRKDLVARFDAHYRGNVAAWPFCVNMTGTYITLMSGLIDLLGWDSLLLAAGTDAARFGDLANRYARWMQPFFDALAESAAPVVMVHDDIVWSSGAFLRPDWYRQYVFPNYHNYLRPLREAGKKILFCSDGNFTEFIDDLVAAGATGLVMEPMTDMAYIAEKYGRSLAFVGNADTRILLTGTRAEIRAEVERCMRIGKGCPGFFMGVGNHIPANTPVENALYYNEVYEELGKR
jgi:uroporphyrinogen-III decarboxylase